MAKRVAVVGVAQTACRASMKENSRDITYNLVKGLLDEAGLKREDIGTIISGTSDWSTGIACSNEYFIDAYGGFGKSMSKTEEDSALAFVYAVMRVMSGHYDLAIAHGITKMSEIPDPSTISTFVGNPFFERQFGLQKYSAAALQCRLYMDKCGITHEQMAKVVEKNRRNATKNPFAHLRKAVSVNKVMKSGTVASPLRELDISPQSDGACAILIASEEKAKQFTKKPAWVAGMGWAVDHSVFSDRDLLNQVLPDAAKRAYGMAGIKDPVKDIDVAEVCDRFSFEEMLWYEGLGFCKKGEGGKIMDKGLTQMDGRLPVNPSGGVLASNPYCARGLVRIGEAALQVMGKAEDRQIPRAKCALAHSTHGLAGQHHTVVVLKG